MLAKKLKCAQNNLDHIGKSTSELVNLLVHKNNLTGFYHYFLKATVVKNIAYKFVQTTGIFKSIHGMFPKSTEDNELGLSLLYF